MKHRKLMKIELQEFTSHRASSIIVKLNIFSIFRFSNILKSPIYSTWVCASCNSILNYFFCSIQDSNLLSLHGNEKLGETTIQQKKDETQNKETKPEFLKENTLRVYLLKEIINLNGDLIKLKKLMWKQNQTYTENPEMIYQKIKQ